MMNATLAKTLHVRVADAVEQGKIARSEVWEFTEGIIEGYLGAVERELDRLGA